MLVPDGKRVYVSNANESSITVIELDSASIAATISEPNLHTPDGCVVSPDSKKLYVTAARKDTVFVFSTETNKLIKQIPVGKVPRRIIFSPDGGKIYVANSGSSTVSSNELSVIDARTETVTGTIKVGREPRPMTFMPDGKTLLVGNIEDDTVTYIKAATGEAEMTVGVSQSPQRLIVTPDSQLLFVVGRIDAVIGIVNLRSVGEYRRIVGTVKVGAAPWGMAMSGDGKYLYVSSNEENNIAVVDLLLMKTVSRVPAGKDPSDVIYRK